MLKDYLIFYNDFDFVRSIILEDIKSICYDWNINSPTEMIFQSITGRRNKFEAGNIKKLYYIQYINKEVNLKEINIRNEPSGKLSCYFAHSWRSKDHPDKFRILTH